MPKRVDPLTKAMIQQVKRLVANKVAEEVLILTLGLPIMALRDEFGFGRQRLERFMEKTIEIYEDYQNGLFTLQEVKDTIEAETGFIIRQGKPKDNEVSF